MDNTDIMFRNCRNCDKRFSCENCKDIENPTLCEEWVLDNEAATCDDCSKRHGCGDYVKGKVTCADWNPEVTCDECSKQDTCPNFSQGGRICDKYDEIRYTLTEKGALTLAMMELTEKDGVYIGWSELMENGFFEALDHEMRLNGLVDTVPSTRIGRVFHRIGRLFRRKPKKDPKDVFLEVSRRREFSYYFSYSDRVAEMAYGKFASILSDVYANK